MFFDLSKNHSLIQQQKKIFAIHFPGSQTQKHYIS